MFEHISLEAHSHIDAGAAASPVAHSFSTMLFPAFVPSTSVSYEDLAAGRSVVCASCGAVNRVVLTRQAQEACCGKCRGRLFAGQPVELNSANFDMQMQRNEVPIALALWAPSCAQSSMLMSSLARAASVLEPNVRVASLNVEAEPELARRFAIRETPMLIIYKTGAEVARHSGPVDYFELVRWAAAMAKHRWLT